jgi:hypothetical protein
MLKYRALQYAALHFKEPMLTIVYCTIKTSVTDTNHFDSNPDPAVCFYVASYPDPTV